MPDAKVALRRKKLFIETPAFLSLFLLGLRVNTHFLCPPCTQGSDIHLLIPNTINNMISLDTTKVNTIAKMDIQFTSSTPVDVARELVDYFRSALSDTDKSVLECVSPFVSSAIFSRLFCTRSKGKRNEEYIKFISSFFVSFCFLLLIFLGSF